MKSLSRQEVIRWIKSQPQTISKSSGGGSGSGGGVSQSWVEENYISKEFFSHLFTIHSTTSGTDVTPNDTDTAVGSIEAMFGLWTEQYISALGQNSSGSGGGGGGSSTLADLLDVELSSSLANGQYLKYNGQKWVNASLDMTGYVTTSDISDMATKMWVGQNYLGTGALNGYATQQWVENQKYLTGINATMVNTALGFTLSGTSGSTYNLANFLTGITSSMVTSALGYTPLRSITSSMVTTALGYTPMKSNVTFWGQSVSNNTVEGDMTSVGSITMTSHIYTSNGFGLYSKDTHNANVNIVTFNGRNELSFGYESRLKGYSTFLQGGTINMSVNNGYSDGVDHGISAFNIESSGRCHVVQGLQGLRIGDGLITWDETNKALKISRMSGDNVVAGNLYALGSVSALGFQSGERATDSATISYLNSTQITTTNLTSSDNYIRVDKKLTFVRGDYESYIYGDEDGNLMLEGSEYIKLTNDLNTDGNNIFMKGGYIYFDTYHSLYVEDGELKYNNNGTVKTVVLQ